MPYGELKINGNDAFEEFGLSLEDGAKAALMTPPPNKERAMNKSRLQHGSRPVNSPERIDSRELSLPMHIISVNGRDTMDCYWNLCQTLQQGTIDIESSRIPNTIFHCKYLSCSNFNSVDNLFKFTLKLEEPNPADRTPNEE